MERAPDSDPSLEWMAPGSGTGLEESVRGLGLGGAGASYPERPGEPDCIYYLRTGSCGYGSRCRFNHPRDRAATMGAATADMGGYPERAGQPLCQHYIRTGTCRYGTSCKYHHPRRGGGSVAFMPLNYYGYPLRPGEKECSYYVKTGQCKFGATCKFHHPMPLSVQVPIPSPPPQGLPVPTLVPGPTLYPSVPSSQHHGAVMARPTLLPGSYSPYGVLLSPGMVPVQAWSPYPAPVTPSSQPNLVPTSVYGMTTLSPSAPAYTGPYQDVSSNVSPSNSSQNEQPLPERPGQPECQYYMKTGDCKFGSSCRYHHPPKVAPTKTDVSLSPMGLPLRPGAPPCIHYARRGVCKFGPACRFDHPTETLSYSPSASSLADMPVAPYPVGFSLGTLAPSSSSSDLGRELLSGSSKDSAPTRSSSSTVDILNESHGSEFSKGEPASHSSMQQSGQSSTSSSSNGSRSAEARTSS